MDPQSLGKAILCGSLLEKYRLHTKGEVAAPEVCTILIIMVVAREKMSWGGGGGGGGGSLYCLFKKKNKKKTNLWSLHSYLRFHCPLLPLAFFLKHHRCSHRVLIGTLKRVIVQLQNGLCRLQTLDNENLSIVAISQVYALFQQEITGTMGTVACWDK